MTSLPSYFTRELQFAWLLRTDVRQTLGKHGERAAEKLFLGWWLVHGRNDYPTVAPLGLEQVDIATAPSELFPESSAETGALTITPLIHYVWLAREDLQQSFELSTESGRNALIAWYYLYGVAEHRLPVSTRERQRLQAASAIPMRHRFPVCLTNLAYLTWQGRDDLQAALPDLSNPLQQLSLIAWYYLQGVHEFRLYAYLADREIATLTEPLAPSDQHGETIPGWLLLAWLLDTSLRGTLDINSPEACQQLERWGEQQGRPRFRIDELIQAQQELQRSDDGNGSANPTPMLSKQGTISLWEREG